MRLQEKKEDGIGDAKIMVDTLFSTGDDSLVLHGQKSPGNIMKYHIPFSCFVSIGKIVEDEPIKEFFTSRIWNVSFGLKNGTSGNGKYIYLQYRLPKWAIEWVENNTHIKAETGA